MMAIFGGKFQELAEAAIRKQTQRPMDPYKAGGPSGYMERINRTRMGGRYQPGGPPQQEQQGGGGKLNRTMTQGNAGGQQVPWAGGGGRQPEWGPGGAAAQGGGNLVQGMGRKFQAAMAGAQGQPGGEGRSGKPNRQMVQGNAGGGGVLSKLMAASGGQQPGAGGGRAWAGGSPGWAGGQQGMTAPWQGSPGTNPMTGGGGGRGGVSGKANRRTVPGNARGGMGGKRGMRRRGIANRMQSKQRRASALGTSAQRATAARAMGTKGGILNKSPVKTMQRGAFEGVVR